MMSEKKSETDSNLILLDEPGDFKKHAVKVLEETRREILLLSDLLDPAVYDSEEFSDALSRFARGDRNAKVKILVKNIRPMVEQGHYLLRLARRLPSKIEIRRPTFEPKNTELAYLMGDRKYLLYKHEEGVYNGFVNYSAAVECLDLSEEFNWLWDKHSVVDASVRSILI
jgi:hypothetical protein